MNLKTLTACAALAACALTATDAHAWGFDGGFTPPEPIAPPASACSASGDRVEVQVGNGPRLTLRSTSGNAMADGARFTLPAPVVVKTAEGREVPLPTLGDLTFDCTDQGFVVELSMDDVPGLSGLQDQILGVQDALDALGSVGFELDPGEMRVALGWTRGANLTDAMGPIDPEAWYLFIDAELDDAELTYEGLGVSFGESIHFTWWLDPTDPAVYTGLRGSLMGSLTTGFLSGVGYGFSNTGNLHWTPAVELRGPQGLFDPQLTGHAAVEMKVGIQPTPGFPVKLVIDGDWMFDLGQHFAFSDAAGMVAELLRGGLRGTRQFLKDLPLDIRFGANARSIELDVQMFTVKLGAASTYAEGGRFYFRTVPDELLGTLSGPFWQGAQGIADLSIGDDPVANERMEKARRVLALLPTFVPRRAYGWVNRNGDVRDWQVSFMADLTYGGCSIQGAQVTFSDAGVSVTHDAADCVFEDWANQALDAMCEGIDDEVAACLEAAALQDCSFECVDAGTCYENCRAAGHGERICNAGCAIGQGTSCAVSDGAAQLCDGLLTACARIGSFCDERLAEEPEEPVQEPTEAPVQQPTEEPIEVPAQPSCSVGGVSGFDILNRGDEGCGRWVRAGDALRASGNSRSQGHRPIGGSMLIKHSDNPGQLGRGRYRVRTQGAGAEVAGLVVHYQNSAAYYLAVMDHRHQRVELWRHAGLHVTKLGQAAMSINLHNGRTLEVHRTGDELVVRVNNVERFSVTDTTFTSGRYGVYSFDNDRMDFTNLSFEAGCNSAVVPGHRMINLGQQGCGRWTMSSGRMISRGDVRTNGQRPKVGSLLINVNRTHSEPQISARIQANDNDAAGLVIDYQDVLNYTFAVIDERMGRVELWRRGPFNNMPGGFRRIGTAAVNLDLTAGHDFALKRVGAQVRVVLNGRQIIDAYAPNRAGGQMGLYTYAMSHAAFGSVIYR